MSLLVFCLYVCRCVSECVGVYSCEGAYDRLSLMVFACILILLAASEELQSNV